MNKNLRKFVDRVNNMDLTHPIQKMDLDAQDQAREVWVYLQKNFWNLSNRDLTIIHLKKICDQYLADVKKDLVK